MTDIFQTQMNNNKNKQKELTTAKAELDILYKEKIIEIAKLQGDLEKSTKSSKLLIDENLKLRQRIQRIKNKRFRIKVHKRVFGKRKFQLVLQDPLVLMEQ
jgi:hypothetical protein